MAMNAVGSREGEPMLEINTTPLIDVMPALLIMLIITLSVMTHAVKLHMPQPRPPSRDSAQTIDLDIDFDGAVLWNGSQVRLADLEGRFRAEVDERPQLELHVRPNRRADYDTVAKVPRHCAAQWHAAHRLRRH